MKDNSSARRQMINAELAARSLNKKAKKIIKEHTPEEEQAGLPLEFLCECSDETCQERISLTIKEYEKLHSNKARFVITEGHNAPEVEKVRKDKENFSVVEKYALK